MAEYMYNELGELGIKKILNSEEEKQVYNGFLPPSLSFIRTVDGTLNSKVYIKFANEALAGANFNTNFAAEIEKVLPKQVEQSSVFIGKFLSEVLAFNKLF